MAKEYRFHPFCDAFPPLVGDEFKALVSDIKANGLREPITLAKKGKTILDGRCRYRACKVAKIRPRFVTWRPRKGETEIDLIISKNVKRRHLNESQRALVGARLATLRRGRPTEKTKTCGITQKQAAKMLGVSERLIQHAHTVLESGVPELVKGIESGELSVSLASQFARKTKPARRSAPNQGELDWDKFPWDDVPYGPLNRAWNRATTRRTKARRQQGQERIEQAAQEARSILADSNSNLNVHEGDCFDLLKTPLVEDGSVDVIYTDPWYHNGHADNYARLGELALRLLRPGGNLFAYCGTLNLDKAVMSLSEHLSYRCDLVLRLEQPAKRINNINVAPRHRHVLWFTKGARLRRNGSVFETLFESPRPRDAYHVDQQAVEDVEYVLGNVLAPNQRATALVVDPFAGFGSFGVGLVRLGVSRFILCEKQANRVAIARRRIKDALEELAASNEKAA